MLNDCTCGLVERVDSASVQRNRKSQNKLMDISAEQLSIIWAELECPFFCALNQHEMT